MSVTDCKGFHGSLENISDKVVEEEGKGMDTWVPSLDWYFIIFNLKGHIK